MNYDSYHCLLLMLYVLELGTVRFVGGLLLLCSHFVVSQVVPFMIGILTIGYVSYYTIVAYDICVMVSVGQ